jgi:hypothetical protein
MPLDSNPVPPEAYMLADHLDAALAAGEDILIAGRKLTDENDRGAREPAALRSSIELIRALELAMITRVLKAREWSQRMSKADARFKLQASSFMSGSHTLVDALAEFADATNVDFDTADGITAYFRSRGVIDDEAACLTDATSGLVTETFRIAGRNELGSLMDMIASYLDALELHFLLFGKATPQQASRSTAMDANSGL